MNQQISKKEKNQNKPRIVEHMGMDDPSSWSSSSSSCCCLLIIGVAVWYFMVYKKGKSAAPKGGYWDIGE